jgi:hypothetical protein
MNTILEQFGKEINQVSQRNLVYKKYEEFVNSFQADSFRLPNDLLID